ncbi:hypothetical protein F5984_12965 [Rudanella paleaurantiibacter]|uniref:ACT domain-containing protein n=1 Tax=Rudanella paleaurantiibacter TaxID=2614655 RepID=A0A7J5TYR9_9BACT|nr:hypothetical protein [Rudanella paleaurantiibacter]KAB7730087.1 hypothetical protein F5984_12965 [Rudanella paleaurantiibacter]
MIANTSPSPRWQTVFQVVGFDRVSFVSDVMAALPPEDHYHIAGVSFEADGIRATGRLTVQTSSEHALTQIDSRLRVVRGLVSVSQTTSPIE